MSCHSLPVVLIHTVRLAGESEPALALPTRRLPPPFFHDKNPKHCLRFPYVSIHFFTHIVAVSMAVDGGGGGGARRRAAYDE
jgi:hypothetical protein